MSDCNLKDKVANNHREVHNRVEKLSKELHKRISNLEHRLNLLSEDNDVEDEVEERLKAIEKILMVMKRKLK